MHILYVQDVHTSVLLATSTYTGIPTGMQYVLALQVMQNIQSCTLRFQLRSAPHSAANKLWVIICNKCNVNKALETLRLPSYTDLHQQVM